MGKSTPRFAGANALEVLMRFARALFFCVFFNFFLVFLAATLEILIFLAATLEVACTRDGTADGLAAVAAAATRDGAIDGFAVAAAAAAPITAAAACSLSAATDSAGHPAAAEGGVLSLREAWSGACAATAARGSGGGALQAHVA